ncbi:sulfatase family protein [Pedosphaera parvula]|uniref:Sulfatase n=1 Tax=Pedosphaera parvula (strain Ellin514) TaxID=320771 RepID=B9XGV9_PEDPL|nr:sulfatase [Pedosphaera parvula]EEF60880.1 sulfatase [Pedosphaera parvula Ellin514]
MTRISKYLLVVAFLIAATFAPGVFAAKAPNIVIILADDLGYGDLGCYGHPSIRTPNLDRMAAEGIRFTDFYVAANVCTPSRAGLMTGRWPIRSGMAGSTNDVLRVFSMGGLPTNEITIAAALKSKGYATACIGKWHLGHELQFLPTHHGFDYFYGLRFSNDMEPVRGKIPKNASSSLHPKLEWWNSALLQNDKILEQPTDLSTLTRRYTEEAIKFIHQNKKQPFFLYFPHTFPHVPLFASDAFKEHSARGLYGDVVEELDWSVGQVLNTLRKEGLAENTLVFFTSDNGPWLIRDLAGGSAGPLKDGKGSTWEGGMREPAIAWWPGKIKPAINHELVCSLDLFTTSLCLAGVALPPDRVIDGLDMRPMLFGTGHSQRQLMFYYKKNELYAVRKGSFKAHLITHTGYSKDAPEKHDSPLLFQLENDPGERFDVAAENPEVVADILREVEEFNKSIVSVQAQY